jgi:anti-sigma B factor antagonist
VTDPKHFTDGGTVIIEAPEDLDVYTAPAVRNLIARLVNGGTRQIVIDMEQVGYMDTAGMAVFIGAQRRLGESGGRLAVVATADHVLRPLRVTGLAKRLHIYQEVADALADLAGTGEGAA